MNAPPAHHIVVLLERTPPFDQLPPEARERVREQALVEYYEPGQVILEQGRERHAYLYIVVTGHVNLIDTQTQRLFDKCGEGDIFGNYGLMRGGVLPYEARAVEPTVCALLPAAAFHTLYHAEPTFAAFFDKDLKRYARTLRTPYDVAGARLLFQTTLGDLIRRAPVACPPGTTAREAAQQMRTEHVGSILVTRNERALGILTNTDLRNKVVADGASPETPVEELMSSPVISLSAGALVFEGLMAMVRHRMHHLVVTDEPDPDARVRGVLSDQDIARAHGYNPAAVIKRLERARSVEELVGVRTEMNGHLMHLFRQGVPPEDLVDVNTEVNDRLTVRVLHLVSEQLRDAHPDRYVDLPWAWMSLGSEGRQEMSLKTDQDNALIYADPSSDEEAERAERWFMLLAEEANDALARCGFTLCPGDVMARNPMWRQPLSQWKQIFRRWVFAPEHRAVLHATIFFDLRGLYGDLSLIDALKDDLLDALNTERGFLTFLMHDALANRPPLSFFRRFVLERSGEHSGTFDIKLRGLMPIVDIARILALEARYLASTNTFDRLEHVQEALPRLARSAEEARDAYRYLVDLRLDHHLQAVEQGEAPNNRIDPSSLSKVQQTMLKAAFSTISDFQDVLAHRYGADMMAR